MTNNPDTSPEPSDDVESRQVKDSPLRRSEEEFDRSAPDVGTDPDVDVSEEAEESFSTWEDTETT